MPWAFSTRTLTSTKDYNPDRCGERHLIERFTGKVKRCRRAFTRFEQPRRRCLRFWHFAPIRIRLRYNANPPRHNYWFRNPLEHTTVPARVPTLRRFQPRNLPGLSPSPPSAQWSADEYCNLSGRAGPGLFLIPPPPHRPHPACPIPNPKIPQNPRQNDDTGPLPLAKPLRHTQSMSGGKEIRFCQSQKGR